MQWEVFQPPDRAVNALEAGLRHLQGAFLRTFLWHDPASPYLAEVLWQPRRAHPAAWAGGSTGQVFPGFQEFTHTDSAGSLLEAPPPSQESKGQRTSIEQRGPWVLNSQKVTGAV